MRASAMPYLIHSTSLVIFCLTLSACGGSSSGDPGPGPGPVPGPIDTTPDEFSFPELEEQVPGETVTSETVTITGINSAAEVTIENGAYAIDVTDSDDADQFVSEPGQIEENQTLTLQTTAPERPEETKEVTVTVGGVTGVFTVGTMADDEPPEAAFVFPAPMTATEADTVIVRGTATDALSTVTRVALHVSNAGGTTDLELDSEDDFATWQKQVALTEGENTITLSAEDEFGNELTGGDSVTVVRQDFELSFPDEELPFENPQKLVNDEARERVLVGGVGDTLVYSVDTNTGKRSPFLTEDMAPDSNRMDQGLGLEISPGGNDLLVLLGRVKGEGPGVMRMDLETREYEVLLTRDSQPDDQPNFTRPTSIRLDPENSDRAIVLNASRRVLSIDLTTGVRTLISNNDESFAGPLMGSPNDLLIDAANNRGLVTDSGNDSLYWVDLSSGNRTLLMTEGVPEGTPRIRVPSITSEDHGRILGVNWREQELWSVDPETGEYEVLSGPEVPHGFNELTAIDGAAVPEGNEYLIGMDGIQNSLFIIDLKTGERVILSKN